MSIPLLKTEKAGRIYKFLFQNFSDQRKVFLKCLVKGLACSGLMLLSAGLISCGHSGEPFGAYQLQGQNTPPFTVEFAYSKTFFYDQESGGHDGALLETGTDEDGKAAMEGWYTVQGDEILCQYTKAAEDATVKYACTFQYDQEKDSLVMTDAAITAGGEAASLQPSDMLGLYEKN